MPKPLKRHQALQPISREHHLGLLLCWKIKTGMTKGIELKRIKGYADYFYHTHVVPHFAMEEQYLFPILGNGHELIIRALGQHRRLESLFEATEKIEEALMNIQEELERHIRFEERILFGEIQKVASADQLQMIEEKHEQVVPKETWKDEFWA
jgi:iron-sulfur cluster repair protein YtfE (RIC family)